MASAPNIRQNVKISRIRISYVCTYIVLSNIFAGRYHMYDWDNFKWWLRVCKWIMYVLKYTYEYSSHVIDFIFKYIEDVVGRMYHWTYSAQVWWSTSRPDLSYVEMCFNIVLQVLLYRISLVINWVRWSPEGYGFFNRRYLRLSICEIAIYLYVGNWRIDLRWYCT